MRGFLRSVSLGARRRRWPSMAASWPDAGVAAGALASAGTGIQAQ